MTTTDEIRKRMEGSLEVIERAVTEWEAAATELAGSDWNLGQAWPRVHAHQPVLEESVGVLTRRLREVPELPERALLRRLAVAQWRARRSAAQRLASLQRSDEEEPDPLEALRSHLPIRYLRWPTPAWPPGPFGLFLGLLAAGVLVLGHAETLDVVMLLLRVAIAGAVVVIALSLGPRESIVLTRRRLRLGSWSMPSDAPITIEGGAGNFRLTLTAGTRWQELEVGRFPGPSVDVRWVGREVLTQLKEAGVRFIGWQESGIGEDDFWASDAG